MCYSRGHLFVDPETFSTYGFEEWIDRGVISGRPVHTTKLAFDAPEIIVTTAVQKFRSTRVNLNKSTVCKRDGFRCQYCGKKFPESSLSLDHVIPKSQGGRMIWENVVAACLKCNVKKGGRTPKQAGMKLLREPFEPRWSPLFARRVRGAAPESWKKILAKK
jgi:5-methylcytosine-specific restriction endonuclease McrA